MDLGEARRYATTFSHFVAKKAFNNTELGTHVEEEIYNLLRQFFLIMLSDAATDGSTFIITGFKVKRAPFLIDQPIFKITVFESKLGESEYHIMPTNFHLGQSALKVEFWNDTSKFLVKRVK